MIGRADFTLSFFRGYLYTFGGCEMYKQCFDSSFSMNINDICPNQCSNNGDCSETLGCICNAPYITNDCSQIIKCKEDCSKNGVCHNNAKCACYAGWSGDICNTMIHCPRNCTDISHGICQSDSTCKCNEGYKGNDCSESLSGEPIDPFAVLNSMQYDKMNQQTQPSNNPETSQKKNTESNQNISNKNTTSLTPNSNQSDKKEKAKALPAKPRKIKPESEDISNNEYKSNYYIIGQNKSIYYSSDDCTNNCTNRGKCLNSTCFCEQGYTSDDCSETYKQYLNNGYKLASMIKYFAIAFGISAGSTLLILIYAKSNKITGQQLHVDT